MFVACNAARCFTSDGGCAHLHALDSISVVAYEALVHAAGAAAGALHKVHVFVWARARYLDYRPSFFTTTHTFKQRLQWDCSVHTAATCDTVSKQIQRFPGFEQSLS